jgi:long-chain fatty acid transport protein
VYKSMTTGLLAATFALATTSAQAAGVDRTVQSMNILFQKGTYVEFGVTHSVANVSGRTSAALGNARIRNIARPVTSGTLAFKSDINDNWSYAVILDQPIGADVLYPSGSLLRGSKARLDSTQLTGILRYSFGNGFSAYGGLRSVWTSGRVKLGPNLPVPALGGAPFNYRMTTNTDQAFGYLVGVAYEQPEIALRVALTYHSEIRHRFKAKESATATPFLNALQHHDPGIAEP